MLSFHVKFVQTDRQTDRRTDGQTDNGKTICPDLSMRGNKKTISIVMLHIHVYNSLQKVFELLKKILHT